jgi:outer membrane lipoprotein-sorting protein
MLARPTSRLVRRIVPAAVVVAAVGAMTAGTVLTAGATPALPQRSAEQLLVDLQRSSTDGLSGTVVQTSDLGFPALPSGGGQGSADLSALITGTHTLRVWYGGPEKARLALLGSLGESDVIRNGRDVWVWSSDKNEALHGTLPADQADRPGVPNIPSATPSGLPSALPSTPEEAARTVLDALDPTTSITTTGTGTVAGRDVYELVLAPKDTSSLVGSVRIAVDAERKVPLRVEVFAKGAGKPAVEVGFTRVSFATPGDEQFRFSPPPGAKVTEQSGRPDAPAAPDRTAEAAAANSKPTIVGTGWTAVAVVKNVPQPATGRQTDANQIDQLLRTLPRTSGSWGSGRVLQSALFSALLTDDGRLVIGAVTPDRLYEVAGSTR